MRQRAARAIVVAMVASGAVGAGASLASATRPDPAHKVTICHATASRTNPYVVITVDVASIVGDSGHGHRGVNVGDIIPPFAVGGYVYAGTNWDGAHQAILANDCNGTAATTSSTISSTVSATQPNA